MNSKFQQISTQYQSVVLMSNTDLFELYQSPNKFVIRFMHLASALSLQAVPSRYVMSNLYELSREFLDIHHESLNSR